MEQQMTRRSMFGLAAAGTVALAVVPLTGCPAIGDWVATAEKDLPIVVSIAGIVVTIASGLTGTPELAPAAMVLIQEAANAFSAGIKALADAVTAYKAAKNAGTLAAITAALNAVEQDAPILIKQITQAPLGIISIITGAIGTAIQLISAIQQLIPSSVVTGNKVAVSPARRVKVQGVKLPDSQMLKSNFNSTLSVYGYGQLALK